MKSSTSICLFFCLGIVACDGELQVPTTQDRDQFGGDISVDADMMRDGSFDTSVDQSDLSVDLVTDMSHEMSIPPAMDMSGPDMSEQDMPVDMVVDMPAPTGLDLSGVTWLHHNVHAWPDSASMPDVTFNTQSRTICLNYDMSNQWPVVEIFDSKTQVVANAWVFIRRDGKWYGATWEWMRPGQTCKSMDSVAGDHIKVNPFGASSNWAPTSGEVLYFMVSGLARTPQYRNVEVRTPLVRVVWP